jgi:carboxymethylenebutenolidase
MENSIRKAKRPLASHLYPGTGHWFFEKDHADAYQARAARLAWKRTVQFLNEKLKGRSSA